jgi:hypothetical protein
MFPERFDLMIPDDKSAIRVHNMGPSSLGAQSLMNALRAMEYASLQKSVSSSEEE